MYGLMMSAREFSSDEPDEDMVTLKLRQLLTKTERNKNMTRTRYTNLGQSEGLYRQKLNIETKSLEETGTETSSGVVSPQGGVARRGPAPPGGEERPDSVSNPFLSRDFSYLIKITKI
jgi:hypothetical protein